MTAGATFVSSSSYINPGNVQSNYDTEPKSGRMGLNSAIYVADSKHRESSDSRNMGSAN